MSAPRNAGPLPGSSRALGASSRTEKGAQLKSVPCSAVKGVMRYAILFCLAMVGCGGDAFQSATIAPVDDAGGAETSTPAADAPAADVPHASDDATSVGDVVADRGSTVLDVATDTNSPPPDTSSVPDVASPPPDTTSPPPVDASAVDTGSIRDAQNELPACDLKPCMCAPGIYYALCCNGPCPSGFEGLTCYCGSCLPPKHYVPDAGTCE